MQKVCYLQLWNAISERLDERNDSFMMAIRELIYMFLQYNSDMLQELFRNDCIQLIERDHRSRDRMVVGFTTTYAISAYHY